MPHLKFSLRTLLVVVAYLALVFASMMQPGVLSVLLCCATVGLLLFAPLAAVYREGAARAHWIGFAVFGWGFYLVGSQTTVFFSGIEGAFPGTVPFANIFYPLEELLGPRPADDGLYYFEFTCRLFLTSVFALMGGLAGRLLYHTRPPKA
jgi:hypothetical protein